MLRVMTIDDYDQVYALWKTIKGFGIRSVDDSREGSEGSLSAILLPAWWQKKMERSWEPSSVVTTGGGAVFTMCA